MSRIIKCVSIEKSSPIVIKHTAWPDPVQRKAEPVVPVVPEISLEAIRSQADLILATAQTAAAQCLANAESQAEELTRQAYEDGTNHGYQEGYNQGTQAAQTEMQQSVEVAVKTAERILRTAEQEAIQMLMDSERQIIDIALAVASKILAREIEENPTAILPIVEEALHKVRDQERIVIRVSPQDYEMVMMAKRDLQLMVGREQAVSFVADNTVLPGSCVIDTASGTVDAKLDTKLEMVHKAIQEAML